MKNLEQIIKFLKKEIEDIMLINSDSYVIKNDSHFVHDLHVDSLDYAALILSGEIFIDCKIDDNHVDWRKVQTIEEMAKFLYDCQK